MQNWHQPVMVGQVLHYLAPQPNQNYVDCTLGGGGHAIEILMRTAPAGKLLAIDLDPQAAALAREKLQGYQDRVQIVQDNFKNLKQIIKDCRFNRVNGILLDLGLSSNQLQNQSRGFSFLSQGKLDMRFNPQDDNNAHQILNTWSKEDLTQIFKEYSQEPLAKKIAQAIVERREKKPIDQPQELVEIISQIYRRAYRIKSKVNPATKVFQALRIAVNNELENLELILPQAIEALSPAGRIVILSYHSLEDKIVKNFFQKESKDCICPPQTPLCQCGHKKTIKVITRKPVVPTTQEILENPRSRSAKLRVAEKIQNKPH